MKVFIEKTNLNSLHLRGNLPHSFDQIPNQQKLNISIWTFIIIITGPINKVEECTSTIFRIKQLECSKEFDLVVIMSS